MCVMHLKQTGSQEVDLHLEPRGHTHFPPREPIGFCITRTKLIGAESLFSECVFVCVRNDKIPAAEMWNRLKNPKVPYDAKLVFPNRESPPPPGQRIQFTLCSF